MAEFNWKVDDIERAQRDFSYNFMRLDCIRTESYDVAIECMTECIERKSADLQPIKHGRWTYPYKDKDINQCSECRSYVQDKISNVREMFAYCPFCGARMDGDAK